MKIFQLTGILLLLLLGACSISNVEDFVVGNNFVKTNAGVTMIDTLTVNSSTVKVDSLASNASGRLLMGCNYNTFSGYMNSNPYFELKFDDSFNYTTFVFDSLCMVLNYDSYYVGDTTVSQTFTIRQLNEQMELNNGSLYTTSHFESYDFPLATFTLAPHPNSKKEIIIRLSDLVGNKLANMIKDQSDTLSTQSLFQSFFNGIVIQSPLNSKGAVFGLGTPSSSSSSTSSTTSSSTTSTTPAGPEMRLYFHLSPNPKDLTGLYYKFSFISDGIYFNRISNDESNSLIDGISATDNELSSKLTDNNILVQSGVQTYAKIKIPYLDNLLLAMGKNSGAIAARLKFYPVKGTYGRSADLPDSLYVYIADRKNKISALATLPGSTNNAFAVKKVIKDVEEQVYYETDVSSFVNDELTELLETNRCLLFGFGSTAAKKTAEHVVLGGRNSGKYAPTLDVYYYHN